MTSTLSVCVYCGSRFGADPAYETLAAEFGAGLAARGMRLVYGGGAVGLMGVVARAALAGGAAVHGVIPKFLADKEVALTEITPVVVDTMHERKALMYEAADAFAVLPGGIGTLEEAIEVISWAQLSLHAKPIVFVDSGGFWRPMLDLLDHVVAQGFAPASSDRYWRAADGSAQALDWIQAQARPAIEAARQSGDVI